MRKTIFITVLLFMAAFVAGSVLAQENIIYPAQGQSAEQMEKGARQQVPSEGVWGVLHWGQQWVLLPVMRVKVRP